MSTEDQPTKVLRIPLDDTVDLSTREGVEELLSAIVSMPDDDIRAHVREE